MFLFRLKANTNGAEREPGQIIACSIPKSLQSLDNMVTWLFKSFAK
jgi:hypothetical protein